MTEKNEHFDEIESEDQDENSVPVLILDLIVDKGQEATRIDKFIQSRLEKATRNKIQKAIEEGMILVNGEKTKANYKIRPLDAIQFFDTREEEITEVIPEDIPLNIVFEDDDILLVNKPAGMVVHPANGNYTGTLVNGLAFYLKKEENELPRIGLVHRIDKNTSGILVIGKHEAAMADLAKQFKAHTVHRRYLALVWGNMDADEGTINVKIGRHARHRKMMACYTEGEYGKEAITHYKVLERFHYVTLVELRLETGRTHQIRVHMKHIGHTLFGDPTYGGDQILKGTVFNKYKQFVENCFKILPRQALHAKELGFVHPLTKQNVLFNSELPEDMRLVLQKWKTYLGGLPSNKIENL